MIISRAKRNTLDLLVGMRRGRNRGSSVNGWTGVQ